MLEQDSIVKIRSEGGVHREEAQTALTAREAPAGPIGPPQNGAGLVVRTDDGGMNLSVQDSRTSFRLNDVYFTDTLHGWAVGNGGTIIHTATGGVTP